MSGPVCQMGRIERARRSGENIMMAHEGKTKLRKWSLLSPGGFQTTASPAFLNFHIICLCEVLSLKGAGRASCCGTFLRSLALPLQKPIASSAILATEVPAPEALVPEAGSMGRSLSLPHLSLSRSAHLPGIAPGKFQKKWRRPQQTQGLGQFSDQWVRLEEK
ncbi:metalloprotease TIKI1 [Dama dama]|uniref:metalloprotease TIKI1 n=1 Tax=Dama dama TaxID=30532 RepID=UPI002A35E80F|nr:metalloprotease TIKI1 [Dama dama]